MSTLRTAQNVAESGRSGYFGVYIETPLKVRFGCNAPRTAKTSCATDGVGLTQFGGVALIEQFFQLLRLQGSFSQHIRFAQRNNRYSISESLEALLYPLILSLGRIETTEPLQYNGVFHYLAGLPGYPEATSLRRFLQRFARAGRNALLKLHDTWRTSMIGPRGRVIFDLDSTVLTVYGQQEHAQVGYNPKKRGRRSYLPLLCFEGQTQDCWNGPRCNGCGNACSWCRPNWCGPAVFPRCASPRAMRSPQTSWLPCGASSDCGLHFESHGNKRGRSSQREIGCENPTETIFTQDLG